jgi:hypothetical protein
MLFLVPLIILFALLALLWVAAAGLLAGHFLAGFPKVLDRVLDYEGKCACHFPFRCEHH